MRYSDGDGTCKESTPSTSGNVDSHANSLGALPFGSCSSQEAEEFDKVKSTGR